MAGPHRRLRPVLGLVFAATISLGWAAAPSTAAAAPLEADVAGTAVHVTGETVAVAALPAWTGGINLYRTGSFSTQKSWLWCTAAVAQMARNMVRHQTDHSSLMQRRYFYWMRAHNKYSLPLSAGVDATGWVAGMRHIVDDRYRLMASSTFTGALKLAVKRMRLTNLPVALAVMHGNHGWLLHGFTATADPAKTDSFTVTSVRVSGPLWGLQNRTFGYDMRPNTKLTVSQLRQFFTPWRYAPKRMIWDGRYISIQPLPL
jgi:hypothetical protein